ncbi:peptidylprolyl isomerase [Paenibacillus sp. LMG 31456]|uniref:Peptidyl-prolyl cis-trans isomerase n=1 Tax=Paenibacillus foliorum TaxID=2654974 RepID=A0A972K0Z4_9BACL|nr:peptidylprolyl isomerase [Paenibacillus foliorum]NOU95181.1 peptidylprolyl isomerase [Paenibacillus foliorum]
MIQGLLALFLLFTSGVHVLSASNDNRVENIKTEQKALSNQVELIKTEEKISKKSYTEPPKLVIDQSKSYQAVIQTSKGDFTIELFANTAPKTVNNFVFLARDGFYNDIVFHRIIKSFMVQTGDPAGNGTGGPGYKFEDELSSPYKYEPGIVAMANAGPNTNGSQFFICTGEDSKSLDRSPNYTIFGKVIEGMDTILKIADTQVEKSKYGELSAPSEKIIIESVTVSER